MIKKVDPEEVKAYLKSIEDAQLAEDVYWAFQIKGFMDKENHDELHIHAYAKAAPTHGAMTMLRLAFDNPKQFYDFLKEAFRRKKQDSNWRDDGRKRLEIFNQAYHHFSEKYLAKRQCPTCGRKLAKSSVLFPRPQESDH